MFNWQSRSLYKGAATQQSTDSRTNTRNSIHQEGSCKPNVVPALCDDSFPQDGHRENLDILLHFIYATAMTVYTMGLYPLFYRQMAFPSKRHSRRMSAMNLSDRNLDVSAGGLVTGSDQWNANIAQLARMWVIVCKGCALLVPLSLAFFQVSGVSNSIYARTTALSACLCSSAGLVASSWYLFRKSQLKTRGMKTDWIEASHSLKSKKSIDFWVCLALPVSSLVWSLFFCVATVGVVIWVDTGKITSVMDMPGLRSPSAVFLTLLITVQIFQIYGGIQHFTHK